MGTLQNRSHRMFREDVLAVAKKLLASSVKSCHKYTLGNMFYLLSKKVLSETINVIVYILIK